MSDLADQSCEPCSGDADPLESDRIAELYANLSADNWDVVEDHHLEGSFGFDDFRDALEFTTDVGELAEEEWHHPSITTAWGEVTITVYTHKIDGLHDADFVLAAKIDQLYAEFESDA